MHWRADCGVERREEARVRAARTTISPRSPGCPARLFQYAVATTPICLGVGVDEGGRHNPGRSPVSGGPSGATPGRRRRARADGGTWSTNIRTTRGYLRIRA
eukprot:2091815-Prymnesium_polylepis.1